MRLLTVLDALRLGGAETLIAQLARVADTADMSMTVLSLHGESPQNSKLAPMLREAGIEPHFLNVKRTIDPGGFRRLVAFIKEQRPDVVHAHLEMSMTMAIPAAKLAGVPAIGTFHHVYVPIEGREGWRERLAVEVATRSNAAIFVSQASLTSFADRYRPGKAPPKTWRVVHNGIDLSYFTPPPLGIRPSLPTDLGLAQQKVVTVLAALRDFKGIQHAIDAWPAVLRRYPRLKLLLVGTGAEEATLRAQASRLGLNETIIFAGLRRDIPDILQASEVVLLPSIYGENLPTVLMEAGGCGRPVVASDVGGISDIVADGETGILVQPGDVVGLSNALLKILDDPSQAEKMGSAGRAHMEKYFDARHWALSLRGVYEEAISSHESGR